MLKKKIFLYSIKPMSKWTDTSSFVIDFFSGRKKVELHDFFRAYEFDPQGMEEVSKSFTLNKYQPGEVIFHEGDESDKFYFIKSGQALVTRKTQGGDDQVLNLLKEGKCFGEIYFNLVVSCISGDATKDASCLATPMKLDDFILPAISPPDVSISILG